MAVFLSSNLPALAVQSLLPALALGRPILLKSPTAEPLFAPAFVRVLCQIEPELGPALAALTWKGGDLALETPILEMAPTVLVYGEQDTVDSVAARAAGTCVTYGPKASLALIGKAVEPAAVAAGLARDIALFDQRGCLSIQAIYTAGDARALAKELGAALAAIEEQWPAGELDPVAASRVQQWRADARLRGLFLCDLPLASGTVIVDPLPDFTPSPGLRTVRICPLALERAIDHLDPWRGRIQGTALAGDDAWGLESRLVDIGVSRCAAPGQLQVPDALWHNGGAHPLEVLGARVPAD